MKMSRTFFVSLWLAVILGAGAVDALARGEYGVLVGMVKSAVTTTPLEEVVNNSKKLDPTLIALAKKLD